MSLEDLIEAYYSCRKNKRNTAYAVEFELDYERNLVDLYREIASGSYQVGKYIAFIVKHPVIREIFAASFRDRIVHHLVINKLNCFFEKQFIFDSYGCRKNKGTLFGIKRIDKFIRSCSSNYTVKAYILKLDIKNFFVSINKDILYNKLESFTLDRYYNDDRSQLLELCRRIIFADPTANCLIKGSRHDWRELAPGKSLFAVDNAKQGLPIGNLTSQIFSNFYLDAFDHFIKHDLKIKYYGRYMDDMVIVHQDRKFLRNLINVAGVWLKNNLQLEIHPQKVYLEPATSGVKFLGVRILPRQIVLGRRIKRNFFAKTKNLNSIAVSEKFLTKETEQKIIASINSYLGIMKHYHSFYYRRYVVNKNLGGKFRKKFFVDDDYKKILRKKSRLIIGNLESDYGSLSYFAYLSRRLSFSFKSI